MGWTESPEPPGIQSWIFSIFNSGKSGSGVGVGRLGEVRSARMTRRARALLSFWCAPSVLLRPYWVILLGAGRRLLGFCWIRGGCARRVGVSGARLGACTQLGTAVKPAVAPGTRSIAVTAHRMRNPPIQLTPFGPEDRLDIACSVRDSHDLDTIVNGRVKDDVRPEGKSSQACSEPLAGRTQS